MNLKFATAILIALAGGVGSGLLAARSIAFRDLLGQICGRGHLLALVQARGIYEADVDRVSAEIRSRCGPDTLDHAPSTNTILAELIRITAAQCIAVDEKISASEVEHELDLLRNQFRDRNTWWAALSANGLSERSLRRMIQGDLRARKWLDRQVASQAEPAAEPRLQFYGEHSDRLALPVRIRVSHLFLAAPPETAPEIVDLKKEKIEALSKRIEAGENFSELAATESEDEASKPRGGDLGYFSAYRMPEDFFKAAGKLRRGETSGPVRTTLGFHIIQMTDMQASRPMTLEEANNEIGAYLEEEKRQATQRRVEIDLGTRIPVVTNSSRRQL